MWEDPAVVGSRKPWAVTFGIGAVLAGCLVAAVAFTAVTFVVLSLAPPGVLPDESPGAVLQLALLTGGLAAIALLVIGPAIAFGVGWLLRDVRNQALHVVAFALAGAAVGAVLGGIAGGLEVASLLGGMLGLSAGVGRLSVAPFARA